MRKVSKASGASAQLLEESKLTLPNALLTGGLLTMADDFLKNDGRKFLDLMEQLAERKIRQLDAEAGAGGDVASNATSGSANGYEDEDYDEDEDDEEYDDDEDEEVGSSRRASSI